MTLALVTAVSALPAAPIQAQTPIFNRAVAAKPSIQRRLVPPPPLPPQGISVQMQTNTSLGNGAGGPNSPAFSLGMATNFSLESIPAPGQPFNRPANGTILFASGDDLAMWLSDCFTTHCMPTVTITNASPQGIVSYALHGVVMTQANVGPAINVAFQYKSINWTMSDTQGKVLSTGNYTFDNPSLQH